MKTVKIGARLECGYILWKSFKPGVFWFYIFKAKSIQLIRRIIFMWTKQFTQRNRTLCKKQYHRQVSFIKLTVTFPLYTLRHKCIPFSKCIAFSQVKSVSLYLAQYFHVKTVCQPSYPTITKGTQQLLILKCHSVSSRQCDSKQKMQCLHIDYPVNFYPWIIHQINKILHLIKLIYLLTYTHERKHTHTHERTHKHRLFFHLVLCQNMMKVCMQALAIKN